MKGMRNSWFALLCLVVLGGVTACAWTEDMMGKDEMMTNEDAMAKNDKMAMDDAMSKDGMMDEKKEMNWMHKGCVKKFTSYEIDSIKTMYSSSI